MGHSGSTPSTPYNEADSFVGVVERKQGHIFFT